MADETIWELEPHTDAKHRILRQYLGAWFPIMASSGVRGRIIFIDGFAGPGIYKGGEPGSPIIALRTLIGHPRFPQWKNEFDFAFFEVNKERCESLREQVEALQKSHEGGWPDNVKVFIEQTTFEEASEQILATLDGANLAPTFAFVDPFGFSGAPMELIERLLGFNSCEVFFNFTAESVNRFVNHPDDHIVGHIEALFGSDEYTAATGLSGESRIQFLHDLYGRKLKEAGGFTYVTSFRMVDERGKTPYWLFHGTRNLQGLRKMKAAVWSVDRERGIQFSDRFAGQDVLFSGDQLDVGPLKTALIERFSGQVISVEDLEVFVLAETPYSDSHYKRILKPLEAAGGLVVEASPRTRRGAFPPGTVIRFVD